MSKREPATLDDARSVTAMLDLLAQRSGQPKKDILARMTKTRRKKKNRALEAMRRASRKRNR